jgi:hypothetical protein
MGLGVHLVRLLNSPSQRKYVFRWLRSRKRDSCLAAEQPWLVFDVIERLRSLPLENRQVFEYGSGGSTIYWRQRGARVTSVEHDPIWYRRMRDHHPPNDGLDYRLVQPEHIGPRTVDPSDPDGYSSADEKFSEHSFARYCRQIDEFPDNAFDVVLIDGRARPSCIKHAHRKVRTGGLLILDNADRDYYLRQAAVFLDGFTSERCRGAMPGIDIFGETMLFTRRS